MRGGADKTPDGKHLSTQIASRIENNEVVFYEDSANNDLFDDNGQDDYFVSYTGAFRRKDSISFDIAYVQAYFMYALELYNSYGVDSGSYLMAYRPVVELSDDVKVSYDADTNVLTLSM